MPASASSVIRTLQSAIQGGAAAGINSTMALILSDLERNAPKRTGLLSSSYRVTQPATASTLKGMIGNSVAYAAYQYPFRQSPSLYKAAPKVTIAASGPTLFSSKPGVQPGKGQILTGEQVDVSKVEALFKKETEQALNAAISKA